MGNDAADKPPLSTETLAAAGLALASERDLAGVGRRLRELLEAWASPSLVLCIEKDPGSPGGWRTVAELTAGTLSPGVERSLASMIEQAAPGSLTGPTLLRTEVTAPNVRPRDNVVVPWSSESASGYLVLRGVPRPAPANLAEAVALVCLPIWARLRPAAAPVPPPRPDEHAERAEAGRSELEALRKKLAAFEKARATAEADRDRAESETAELRDRVEALERKLERAEEERRVLDTSREAAARSDAALLARRLEELQAAQRRLAELGEQSQAADTTSVGLREKLDAAAAEREALARERDQARAECQTLRASLESLERRLDDERRRFEAESASSSEEERAAGEREARLRATLDEERAALEAERAKLRSENHMLYASIESWERQLREQARGFDAERAGLAERTAQLERRVADADAERDATENARQAAQREAAFAEDRAERAETERRRAVERWEGSVGAFRAALDALRRTPFVPPTLRVSMAGAESALAEQASPARSASMGIRVLLLDRDTPALERLAGELEQAGLEVLVAHYPEEVSFFLKTSEARRLAAAVCDVMAFRGDQNLIEAFRAWRQDLAGLALFLSFKADNPTEAERARRVPSVLTAGYLKRPLESAPLVEALVALGRRPAARS
jgi:hypothetical protein